MKRSFKVICLIIVFVLASNLTYAYENKGLKLIINGSAKEFDPAPVIVNDRTMLPVRFVSESLGFDVKWDGRSKKVSLTKGEKTISFTVGSDEAGASGVDDVVKLDAKPFIKDSRTFVPLRFVSEAIGESVKWDGANKTVIIGDYYEKVDDDKNLILYISEKFGFSLAIPEEVYNKLAIIEKDKAVYFYVRSIYDKSNDGTEGFTGRIFSIGRFDNPINLYHGGAAINLFYRDGYYNALFASDVNFAPEDEAKYTELWRNSVEFLHSFRVLDDDASINKGVMVQGKIAMLTEDCVVNNPYMITVDTEGNVVRENLTDEKGYLLQKNDMVIVTEENESTVKVVQAFGDIPRLRGFVDRSKLSYDAESFIKNANQVVLDDVMGYDGVDGNENGVQSAIGTILERSGDWVKVAMPAGASDLWFKVEDLSYDFAKIVFDIRE